MRVLKITRIVLAAALIGAVVPAALAQPAKKQVTHTVIVRDGQVITDDGIAPRHIVIAQRGFLGVQMVDLTPELREHFHVQKDAGVLVSKVVPESPAAKAGIRVGDIITSVNGVRVESPSDVARAVRDHKKGEAVKIDYARDGANATAMATIVERERREVDLRDLDLNIDIPEIHIPDVGRNLDQYFNSPEWKAKVEHMQQLPDCSQMQERMKQLELKMKNLEKRLSTK